MVTERDLEFRRQAVYLVLAGIFIGCMSMLNILGITKFIQLGPLSVAVGVLPYPLTFLCTDILSEFYGRKRTNIVVWVGLLVNFLLIAFVWLGQQLPSVAIENMPPWQILNLESDVILPSGEVVSGKIDFFHLIYGTTFGAVFASLIAYVTAQFCDVYLFHYWKRLTKGKHLWLRNNGSTLVSQAVDSIAVIFITFGSTLAAGKIGWAQIWILLLSNYAFKFVAALIDTPIIYLAVRYLKKYLSLDPNVMRE